MILSIETATSVCSVAFEDGAGEVFEKRTESHGSHSEKLFLFIKELMQEHSFKIDGLEAVLVSEGPGSYTGLRIAASGVKGMLFGSEVPLYGVQTLASFAAIASQEATSVKSIHAVIDARRKHLYHQQFILSEGVMEAKTEAGAVPIDSLQKIIQPGDILTGTGIDRLGANHKKGVQEFGRDFISARSVIALFHRIEAQSFMQKSAPSQFDPRYYASQI